MNRRRAKKSRTAREFNKDALYIKLAASFLFIIATVFSYFGYTLYANHAEARAQLREMKAEENRISSSKKAQTASCTSFYYAGGYHCVPAFYDLERVFTDFVDNKSGNLVPHPSAFREITIETRS